MSTVDRMLRPPAFDDAPLPESEHGEANDTRPEIVIDTDEARVNDEALAALARYRHDGDPVIYRRGPFLVRAVRGGALPRGVISHDPDAPSIESAPAAYIGETLSRAAQFVRIRDGKDGEQRVPAHPPKWTISALPARLEWSGLPHLEGVAESPTLRPDGSVLSTPGYDAASGLLYLPSEAFPAVPERPARGDAQAAASTLVELLRDFPFAKGEHRAAALAAILTPHARFAFAGPAPLALIDASTAAAGKSLLADVIGIIALGRRPARSAHVTDEAETEKRIMSLGLSGARFVVVDNIVGVFGGASMCMALTATTYNGRMLGRTESVTVPMLICWVATGNNVQLAADMSRRVLHVRLEPDCERPEERSGFAHADLLAHVAAERPRLVVAALTILRAHALAGRPDRLSPWGSFEGWSRVVRAAVEWSTGIDPGAGRAALRVVADVELESVRALVLGWRELAVNMSAIDVSAREAIGRLFPGYGKECPSALLELRDAVEDLCRGKPGFAPTPRALGKALSKYRKRVVDGYALDGKDDGHGIMRWRAVEVGND